MPISTEANFTVFWRSDIYPRPCRRLFCPNSLPSLIYSLKLKFVEVRIKDIGLISLVLTGVCRCAFVDGAVSWRSFFILSGTTTANLVCSASKSLYLHIFRRDQGIWSSRDSWCTKQQLGVIVRHCGLWWEGFPLTGKGVRTETGRDIAAGNCRAERSVTMEWLSKGYSLRGYKLVRRIEDHSILVQSNTLLPGLDSGKGHWMRLYSITVLQ
jgi:hypothetical protein